MRFFCLLRREGKTGLRRNADTGSALTTPRTILSRISCFSKFSANSGLIMNTEVGLSMVYFPIVLCTDRSVFGVVGKSM